jgi:hypothetical protein
MTFTVDRPLRQSTRRLLAGARVVDKPFAELSDDEKSAGRQGYRVGYRVGVETMRLALQDLPPPSRSQAPEERDNGDETDEEKEKREKKEEEDRKKKDEDDKAESDDGDPDDKDDDDKKKKEAIARRMITAGSKARNEAPPTFERIRQRAVRAPARYRGTSDTQTRALAMINAGRIARGELPLKELPR